MVKIKSRLQTEKSGSENYSSKGELEVAGSNPVIPNGRELASTFYKDYELQVMVLAAI